MLDKVFEKLGIYDILAVLLTGIIICSGTILISAYVDFFILDFSLLNTNSVLLFLLISYFTGLLFQEIGSSIEKHFFYKNNRLLLEVVGLSNSTRLFRSRNSNSRLTQVEWNEIVTFVSQKLKFSKRRLSNEKIERIYNYCKYNVLTKKNRTGIDKDHSMSAMARSLTFYFFTCLIGLLFGYYTKFLVLHIADIRYCYIMLLCVSFVIIFYLRGIRFAKIRFIKILRLFYYQNVVDPPKTQNNTP